MRCACRLWDPPFTVSHASVAHLVPSYPPTLLNVTGVTFACIQIAPSMAFVPAARRGIHRVTVPPLPPFERQILRFIAHAFRSAQGKSVKNCEFFSFASNSCTDRIDFVFFLVVLCWMQQWLTNFSHPKAIFLLR